MSLEFNPIKRSLFTPRKNIKPYEYPELLDYKDAMRHSYWLHTEFNFTSDVQDYRVHVTDKERNVLTKCMLAISQIEVTVKRFWSDLYHFLPKWEISSVGTTFGESEERHFDAYSFLLELLGMNEMFEKIEDYPALMKRVEYMEAFMANKTRSESDFILSMVLFSSYIEHISLFSQFLIMMSFNKHKNLFKGLSNAIEATSKEEELHGRFGIHLYQIMKEENPELFTETFYQDLRTLALQAFEAEKEIINWIFEEGNLDFLSKETVLNYITSRYNNSFVALGLDAPYEVDIGLLEETKWFDIEVLSTKETDFFNKRSIDYSKKNKQITADDLF